MMDERDDKQSAAVLNESQVGFHVPPVEASGTVSQEGQSCPSTSSGGQDCPRYRIFKLAYDPID